MPSSGGQTCALDRKSTRLNSSHGSISYAVFCFKKKRSCWTLPRTGCRSPIPRLSSTPRCRDRVDGWALVPVLVLPLAPLEPAVDFFFFNDAATPEIYPLSLPDALPIFGGAGVSSCCAPRTRWCGTGTGADGAPEDRKSTRLNSSHGSISYAGSCFQ